MASVFPVWRPDRPWLDGKMKRLIEFASFYGIPDRCRASRTGFVVFFVLWAAACTEGGITDDANASRADQVSASTVRGSATLSWMPPTKNTDGSRLTDLAGYKIYYGTSDKYLQRVIEVKDPSATEYTISDLPPFTYYFSVTAYSATGAESERSNMQTKTIQ